MLAVVASALVFCLLLLAYFIYDTLTRNAESRRQDHVRRRLGASAPAPSPPAAARVAPKRPMATGLPAEEDLFKKKSRTARIRYEVSEQIAYRLAQANIPFRVGQYVLATTMTSLVAALVMLAVFPQQPWLSAGVGIFIGVFLAVSVTRWRLRRRVHDFTSQLPDALTLLASALRTGQAMRTGLELVAEEMPAPLGNEFAKVVQEINLGLREADALNNLSERIDSVDVQMFVTSVLVQGEIGGNLAEILDSTRETIRERFKIEGQVETHTAVARYSGSVLVVLPIALAVLVSLLQPNYLTPLIDDPIGKRLLFMAVGAWAVGWLWIRRIMAIRI